MDNFDRKQQQHYCLYDIAQEVLCKIRYKHLKDRTEEIHIRTRQVYATMATHSLKVNGEFKDYLAKSMNEAVQVCHWFGIENHHCRTKAYKELEEAGLIQFVKPNDHITKKKGRSIPILFDFSCLREGIYADDPVLKLYVKKYLEIR